MNLVFCVNIHYYQLLTSKSYQYHIQWQYFLDLLLPLKMPLCLRQVLYSSDLLPDATVISKCENICFICCCSYSWCGTCRKFKDCVPCNCIRCTTVCNFYLYNCSFCCIAWCSKGCVFSSKMICILSSRGIPCDCITCRSQSYLSNSCRS